VPEALGTAPARALLLAPRALSIVASGHAGGRSVISGGQRRNVEDEHFSIGVATPDIITDYDDTETHCLVPAPLYGVPARKLAPTRLYPAEPTR
jgi:hypothetical protein